VPFEILAPLKRFALKLFVDLGCFLRRPTRYITQFRFDFASEISFAEIHEGLDVKTEPFAAEMGEDVEEDGGGGRRDRSSNQENPEIYGGFLQQF